MSSPGDREEAGDREVIDDAPENRMSDRDELGASAGYVGKLDRVLLTATRQGDAHGDVARAIDVIRTGLARHPEAGALDRVPVLAYLAELHLRDEDDAAARAVLAELDALPLDDADRLNVASELRDIAELRRALD